MSDIDPREILIDFQVSGQEIIQMANEYLDRIHSPNGVYAEILMRHPEVVFKGMLDRFDPKMVEYEMKHFTRDYLYFEANHAAFYLTLMLSDTKRSRFIADVELRNEDQSRSYTRVFTSLIEAGAWGQQVLTSSRIDDPDISENWEPCDFVVHVQSASGNDTKMTLDRTDVDSVAFTELTKDVPPEPAKEVKHKATEVGPVKNAPSALLAPIPPFGTKPRKIRKVMRYFRKASGRMGLNFSHPTCSAPEEKLNEAPDNSFDDYNEKERLRRDDMVLVNDDFPTSEFDVESLDPSVVTRIREDLHQKFLDQTKMLHLNQGALAHFIGQHRELLVEQAIPAVVQGKSMEEVVSWMLDRLRFGRWQVVMELEDTVLDVVRSVPISYVSAMEAYQRTDAIIEINKKRQRKVIGYTMKFWSDEESFLTTPPTLRLDKTL